MFWDLYARVYDTVSSLTPYQNMKRLSRYVKRGLYFARNPKIIIAVTQDPETIAQIQRLRAQVYEGDGLETPDRFADGRYIDPDDLVAYHLAAYDATSGNKLMGAFKLTIRTPDQPMRVEQFWDEATLRLTPGIAAAEMTRLAVLPKDRGKALSVGLWHAAFRQAQRSGVEYAYAMQRSHNLDKQLRMGIPVEVLGKPVEIKGHQYTPTRINIGTFTSELARSNLKLAYFFAHDMADGRFEPLKFLRPSRTALQNFQRTLR